MNGKTGAKKHLGFEPPQRNSVRCLALFMLIEFRDEPLYPLY